MQAPRLAHAHGIFNLVAGLWPLLHYPSFEAVSGPKTDHWLVKTVAGLLAATGYTQLRSTASPEGRATARRIGLATAATFITVDLRYVSTGHLNHIYLVDAVIEGCWLAAWATEWLFQRPYCRALPTDRRRPTSGPALTTRDTPR